MEEEEQSGGVEPLSRQPGGLEEEARLGLEIGDRSRSVSPGSGRSVN